MTDQAPAPAMLPSISLADASWYLERAGVAFMEAGLRPTRKFKSVAGDRAAFHPPRSRAELKLVENLK